MSVPPHGQRARDDLGQLSRGCTWTAPLKPGSGIRSGEGEPGSGQAPPTQPRPRLAYLGHAPPPPGPRPVVTLVPSPPASRSSPSPEDRAENPDKGSGNANRHIALAHGGPEVKSETEVTLLPFLVLPQCLGFLSGRPR